MLTLSDEAVNGVVDTAHVLKYPLKRRHVRHSLALVAPHPPVGVGHAQAIPTAAEEGAPDSHGTECMGVARP